MCHKIDVHIDLLHVIAYGPTVAKVYTSSYLELKPQRWAGGEKRHFRICVINIALSGASGKSALLLLACVEPKSDREERTNRKVPGRLELDCPDV